MSEGYQQEDTTGTVCVNKSFLSFNNPDPMDQILASHRAEEMVCVFKDPFEVKLSFTSAVSNSSFLA